MKRPLSVLVFTLAACLAWAGGAREAAGSATRGKYLAGRGVIVPPEEIVVDNYVAQIDYNYPPPEAILGVSLYTGHRQVSTDGQREILQIGIQARELPFEEMQPLNIGFVIDKSGSMAGHHKMDYVKTSFDVFIQTVRQNDFVALVAFDDRAQVLFPSTQMDSPDQRERFRSVVRAIEPEGGTNLTAGLRLGYEQVLSNFRSEYVNRVLFLTDGVGESAGIMELADSYREMDIHVSAIAVGDSIDLGLVNELARRGGGSSRFLSDSEEMEKTFGSELGRMAVPAAHELEMRLEFLLPVEILGTWGYDHRVEGNRISYFLPTLHHGDYETILVDLRTSAGAKPGRATLARFSLSYRDLRGAVHRLGPFGIEVELVDMEAPVAGLSSGMVLRSGTALRFAQALKRIGEIYYSAAEAADPETQERIRTCLDIALAQRKELKNVRLRLDGAGFDDEIGILDNYIRILGQDLGLEAAERERLLGDEEIPPPVAARPLGIHLENLFREITLAMQDKGAGAIAVVGFAARTDRQPGLIALLNEMSVRELAALTHLKVVEAEKLERVMQEQELSRSDLIDTGKAIAVGRLLAATYVLTGTIVEMPGSVVVFARIVNVESGEIESAAQVILPKSDEVRSLL